MTNYVDKAKEVIKQEIRDAHPGDLITINIEDVEENVRAFERALTAPDIQRMLFQQNKRAQLQPKPRVSEQAKRYMLHHIRNATLEVRHIIFPCEWQDHSEFSIALNSPEVQAALQRRNLTAQLRDVTKDNKPLPDILITTIEDATNGKLDEYLRKIES